DLPWHETDFASNRETIRKTVSTVVDRGTIPILIGGDDSIPIPMLDALGDTGKRYTVLQIDAHIDWRDEYLGEKLGLSSNMRRASEMGHVENIIQVGARGTGSAYPQDVGDCLGWGVHLIPASRILHDGVQQALDHISDNASVAICIDIDGLDPSITPNTIGRTPGGLGYQHALDLIKGVADKAKIAAVNFAEIFPEADIDGQGGMTVSRLVAATMGIVARQQMAK
ncbi:MAG: arginase, partial [Gammaproteobacteria bacterium]|nr:arginase [Gammaproteobacteria bacterium]